jgi:predicted AlkP superfamily phosphohydrolase/phosphomutase
LPSVVVIGLDAAEVSLVRRFMADGTMPTLASLAERGATRRLSSVGDLSAEAVWPSFLYGVHPGKHGLFGSYQIRPGTLDVGPSEAHQNPHLPFYAEAQQDPPRTIVLDVPKSYAYAGDRNVSLVAWGAHAARATGASHPPELYSPVVRDVGRYPLPLLAQEDDVHDLSYYRDLRRRLLEGVGVRNRLHRYFLERDSSDLFITVFSETHVAGHRFWHFMDAGHPWHDAGAPAELKTAIRDVYSAVDEAVGELIRFLPGNVTVLVASVHGMTPNYNAQELLPRFIERYCGVDDDGGTTRPLGSRLLADGALGLRSLVPPAMRARIKQYVSGPLRQRFRSQYLKALWGWDRWPRMRVFCTPTEDHGYLRVNLKGREPHGLVEPGAEYEVLLSELAEELLSLRDVESGCAVIGSVLRPQEKYPGPAAVRMPDLVVHWAPGMPIRGLRSARFGDVVVIPRFQHRSGLHQPEGFLVAAGPSIVRGVPPADAGVLDLAPTILSLLGRPVSPHLDGRLIPDIVRRPAAAQAIHGGESQ